MSPTPLRLLLDANVWRHMADYDGAAALEELARRRNLTILVSPAVVYEALRTKDEALRSSLIRAMTRRAWERLMPEAYELSEEFLREVRRLRPSWLRGGGKHPVRTGNRLDWLPSRRGGFWDRVRTKPAVVAGHLGDGEGGDLDLAREEARARRRTGIEAGWGLHRTKLGGFTARSERPVPGWDGGDVAAWKANSMSYASRRFGVPPYSDWLAEVVDFKGGRLFREASWVRFWANEVEAANMPRWWCWTACELAQSMRKVSDGTPCDAQLSTYLFSADFFLTHDRAFADILEWCREDAPRPMARSRFLLSTGNAWENALEEIRALSAGRSA